MMILVDTSVWSLALRRKRRDLNLHERKFIFRAREAIIRGDAVVIPLIRQEVLSGIAVKGTFETIRSQLAAIETLATPNEVFILAAEFFNACRAAGAGPGAIDMSICAAASWHDTEILSADPDFDRYATILPIKLHHV